MGLLDRIRKNREKSVLPDEVKQYYQSENRQRRGVAIVLAIVALLVTIAVAAALFFGGRFVYNKVTGDDEKNKPAETSQNENQDDAKKLPGFDNPSQEEPSGDRQDQPSANSAPAPAPAPSNPTTPALGDEPLPRTGDEGL